MNPKKVIYSDIPEFFKKFGDALWISFTVFVTSFLIVLAYQSSSDQKIEILANIQSSDSEYFELQGVIISAGKPIEHATVWLIIQGDAGKEAYPSPQTVLTGKKGDFKFGKIPKYLSDKIVSNKSEPSSNKNTTTFTTRSKTDTAGSKASEVSSGRENIKTIIVRARIRNEEKIVESVLTLNSSGGITTKKPVKINYFQVAYLPFIFLFSFLFPFIIKSRKVIYICSISSAILFSGAIILSIAIWVGSVSTINQEEILSLGFMHFLVHNGEWVLSLTSPLSMSKGFWVPVWVMLLSVIGSSLFTVLIILSEIKNRPNWNSLDQDPKELKKFNKTIENIVRHQFYMLFSPLGSVFVYQLLILGNANENSVTVAIAALASGLLLNGILDKALTLTKTILANDEDPGGGGDKNNNAKQNEVNNQNSLTNN